MLSPTNFMTLVKIALYKARADHLEVKREVPSRFRDPTFISKMCSTAEKMTGKFPPATSPYRFPLDGPQKGSASMRCRVSRFSEYS